MRVFFFFGGGGDGNSNSFSDGTCLKKKLKFIFSTFWAFISFRKFSKPKMDTFKLIGSPYKAQKVNSSGFVVIGAGLPRTGTSSMREALSILLVNIIYVILLLNFMSFLGASLD